MASDPSLAVFLVAAVVWAATVGAYIGISRARAPFNAPEAQDIVDCR